MRGKALLAALVLAGTTAAFAGLVAAFAVLLPGDEGRAVSPAARRTTATPVRPAAASATPAPGGAAITAPFQAPILEYHHIGEDTPPEPFRALVLSPARFEAQLSYLRCAGYTGLTVSQLFDAIAGSRPLPDKAVVITFDDGYLSQYRDAFPLLRRYGFPASFAVITGAVGSGPTYMTWDQLREMTRAGMEMMSHTVNHTDLSLADDEASRAELTDSKAELERQTGGTVAFFVYPSGEPFRSRNGVRAEQVAAMLREAGYRGALLAGPPSSLQDPAKPYALNRIEVLEGAALEVFAATIGGPLPHALRC